MDAVVCGLEFALMLQEAAENVGESATPVYLPGYTPLSYGVKGVNKEDKCYENQLQGFPSNDVPEGEDVNKQVTKSNSKNAIPDKIASKSRASRQVSDEEEGEAMSRDFVSQTWVDNLVEFTVFDALAYPYREAALIFLEPGIDCGSTV
ncbi:hypothetical protein L6452_41452 [Arctium lappa]|uniref:Uncharacterized protein n=1 Tax=Arctium lappa TaxID=4217 RepID=A0ACB8XP05_ARCLA|nr:hypothetical protein L6452_41452 [Arctium lappa]